MRNPLSRPGASVQQDRWLEDLLEASRGRARAPQGFARKVMDAVYRESLAGRTAIASASSRATLLSAAMRASRPMVGRMYRRLGLSFVLTAAVLTASLLVPHGAYTLLIGSGTDAALGRGPSAAVQNALAGAGHAVQGALGEQLIGGNQE